MYQGFIDVELARTRVALAKMNIGQNDDLALKWSASGCFVARRASYRLFVFMTSRILENAKNILDSIPSYLPRPENAVDSLKRAFELNRTVTLTGIFTSDFSGDAKIAWQYFSEMDRSLQRLWWDLDSVRELALLAKQQVISHLAEQKPVLQKTIAAELRALQGRLNLEFTVGAIITIASFVTGFGIMKRQRRTRTLLRAERIAGPNIAGGLLASAAVALPLTTAILLSIAIGLAEKAKHYELALPASNLLLITQLALVVSLLAFLTMLINFVGYARWRFRTGSSFLIVIVTGIALLLIGWFTVSSTLDAVILGWRKGL